MTTDTFNEIAQIVFGGGLDESLVSKANPDGADLSTSAQRKKTERRQAQVGLASNVLGLGAGLAGTKDAYEYHRKVRKVPKGGMLVEKPKMISGKTKGWAGALLGLQVANVAGDAVANRVLARSAKNDKKVKKSNDNLNVGTKGKLILVGHAEKQARKTAPKVKAATKDFAIDEGQKVKGKIKELSKRAPGGTLRRIPAKPHEVAKSTEILWEGEFSKFDMDKRQVFGWASIVKKDGEDIVDLQGDYISIDEIEKSAYDYVVKSRKGGNQHLRNGEEPLHVSDMIESFIVTPEKIEKMGLPDDTPLGWWVGYQINDPDTWDQVKSGKRTGFSIHGRGRREST